MKPHASGLATVVLLLFSLLNTKEISLKNRIIEIFPSPLRKKNSYPKKES